jgi:hypothetical protein
MMKRTYIHGIVFGIVALALVLVAGCGGGGTTTAVSISEECLAKPTIIPANTGKPQLIEFFRDT